jgi:hypothetical protein
MRITCNSLAVPHHVLNILSRNLAARLAFAALLAAVGANQSIAQSMGADFGPFYGATGTQYLNVITDTPTDDVCTYTLVSGNGASTSVGNFSMPYAINRPDVAGLQVTFTPNGVDGSFGGNFVSTYQDGCNPYDYYVISVEYSGDSMIPVATASPRYQVLSLLYVAPGNESSSGFSNTQSAGATTSYSHNFTTGTSLSFSGGILGASNSVTFSKSQSQGASNSFQTNYQATSSSQLSSTQQKMDHTQDQVYLEIDPTITLTQNGDASGFFQIGPSVDATGTFTNGTPADIINANIAGFNNPSLIPVGALKSQVRQAGTTLPGLKYLCANPLPDNECTQANACGCVASDFAAIPPQDELANVTNDSEQPNSVDSARYVFITSEPLEATGNTYDVNDSNISGYSTSSGTSYTVSYGHSWKLSGPFTIGITGTTSLEYDQTQTVGTQNGTAHDATVTLKTSDANCFEYVDIYEDTTYHTFAYALPQPAPPECQ